MGDVLVRDVPEHVLESLRKRAAQNGRSLERELVAALQEAALDSRRRAAIAAAATFREELAATGKTFSDSTELIRADRER